MPGAIKFRPIKPRLPQLKGQVERAQRTSLQEFWSSFELDTPELEQRLQEWQHYYRALKRPIISLSAVAAGSVKVGASRQAKRANP